MSLAVLYIKQGQYNPIMGIHLNRQEDMLRARQGLTDCYICGAPLPPPGPGRNGKCKGDHVLPRAVLDMAAAIPGGDFPLVLDVHAQCEDRCKRGRDQVAKIVQMMCSSGPQSLADSEVARFRNQCDMSLLWVGGVPAPVIGNAQEILLAAMIWVRGFHAALYGEVLPSEIEHRTRCPAPGLRSEGGDFAAQLREETEMTNASLGVLGGAIEGGATDRVTLRAGAIDYRCTWVASPYHHGKPWSCIWALDLPGSEAWSTDVRRRHVPWHGAYLAQHKPPAAAQFTFPGYPPSREGREGTCGGTPNPIR
jgi:hypothetical protein